MQENLILTSLKTHFYYLNVALVSYSRICCWIDPEFWYRRDDRMGVSILETGLPNEQERFQILSIHSDNMKENSFLSADELSLEELGTLLLCCSPSQYLVWVGLPTPWFPLAHPEGIHRTKIRRWNPEDMLFLGLYLCAISLWGMVSWLLSIVVCAASRTKNFSRAELEALVESAKRFAVVRSWYVRSKWYPFPWVMFWGIHSKWKFRVQCPSTFCFLEVSATQQTVIESVQDCTTSREVLRWLALQYEHAERVTIDVKKQEIKRCRYSLYSWSCFLFY